MPQLSRRECEKSQQLIYRKLFISYRKHQKKKKKKVKEKKQERKKEGGKKKKKRKGKKENKEKKRWSSPKGRQYEKGRTSGCWSGYSNIQLTMEYLKKIVFFSNCNLW